MAQTTETREAPAQPPPETFEMPNPWGHLPEVYLHYNLDNSVSQIREPCYRLLAEQYLDETLWQEGEVIVTGICPNHHMEPLNRAAGERIQNWLASLPYNRTPLNVDDALEAVQMLSRNPDFDKMTQQQRGHAVAELASRLKERRDGQLGMVLPPIAGPTFGTRRSNAPAMANARFTDPSRRGPGHYGEQAVLHAPQRPQERVARATSKPAMGNVPPARSGV